MKQENALPFTVLTATLSLGHKTVSHDMACPRSSFVYPGVSACDLRHDPM